MLIKILWTGCTKCQQLESNVKTALEQSWVEATVEKITDIADIMAYGVMGTPALVIDETIVSSGKLNDVSEIIGFLKGKTETKIEWCCGCCCQKKC